MPTLTEIPDWFPEWLKRSVRAIYVAFAMLLFFAGGYLLLSPMITAYLRGVDDETGAAVLFGTATVSLTAVAILLAVIAFFGWDWLRGRVEDEVKKWWLDEREYDKAQGRFVQGVMFGLISQYLERVPKDENGERDVDFLLGRAISNTERALPRLSGTDLEPHAKNNLAYCLALRGHRSDARRALELITEAESAAKSGGSPLSYSLTRGEVVATYGAYSEDKDPKTLVTTTIEELEDLQRKADSPLDAFKAEELKIVLRRLRKTLATLQQSEDT